MTDMKEWDKYFSIFIFLFKIFFFSFALKHILVLLFRQEVHLSPFSTTASEGITTKGFSSSLTFRFSMKCSMWHYSDESMYEIRFFLWRTRGCSYRSPRILGPSSLTESIHPGHRRSTRSPPQWKEYALRWWSVSDQILRHVGNHVPRASECADLADVPMRVGELSKGVSHASPLCLPLCEGTAADVPWRSPLRRT